MVIIIDINIIYFVIMFQSFLFNRIVFKSEGALVPVCQSIPAALPSLFVFVFYRLQVCGCYYVSVEIFIRICLYFHRVIVPKLVIRLRCGGCPDFSVISHPVHFVFSNCCYKLLQQLVLVNFIRGHSGSVWMTFNLTGKNFLLL